MQGDQTMPMSVDWREQAAGSAPVQVNRTATSVVGASPTSRFTWDAYRAALIPGLAVPTAPPGGAPPPPAVREKQSGYLNLQVGPAPAKKDLPPWVLPTVGVVLVGGIAAYFALR